MGAKNSNIDQLIDILQPNSIVLTPNQRLSRALNQALTDVYQNQFTTWQSPSVLPLNTWLLQLVEAQRIKGEIPLKPFAHPLEELDAWQAIIEADTPTIVRPKALAKTARAAYKTVCEWQLDIDQYSFDFSAEEDAKHYMAWHRSYRRQQQSSAVISQIDAISLLPNIIETLDVHIVLVGFQSIAPLYQTIIDKALSLQHFDWCALNSVRSVYAAADPHDELREMAAWAHATTQANPQASIALCVPELSQNRAAVMAHLDDSFQANAVMPGQLRDDGFYDISAGVSLAETPLGQSLLGCLNAMKRELPITEWRQLLMSPLLSIDEDETTVDAVIEKLKRFPLPQSKLGSLTIWLGTSTPLEALYQHAKTLNATRPLNDWAAAFKQIAQLWGWGVARTLNSHEYQQHQLCLQSLLQLSRLQLSITNMGYNKAVEALTELMAQQVFHAQTPATKLSVLGCLEAAGQTFDYLWACGLQDNQWPPKLAPNPLIPQHLQHSLDMPHGSTQREFDYAHELLNGFSQGANNIVLSYLKTVDDVAVGLSRLIECDEPLTVHVAKVQTIDIPQLDQDDIDDPLVATLEGERTVAATVLRDQSQCPFKAFASHRLQLKASQRTSEGLNAADRGRLLHRSFEAFFSEQSCSEAIAALADNDRQTAIKAAATLAINDFPAKYKRLYRPALFELEQWRLEALLDEWLSRGETRTSAYKVHALEYEYSAHFGDTLVNMRLDRIDVVNQQWFIIDYKSSVPSSHNWQAERLADPQLPLYAVALADNAVCGIAVAHIRPNESALKALATDAAGAGKPIDGDAFQHLLGQWRSQITGLADEYATGVASVQPLNSNVCSFCDYSSVCRIFEADEQEQSSVS